MINELLPKNSKSYFMRFYMQIFLKEQERGGIPLQGRRQRRVRGQGRGRGRVGRRRRGLRAIDVQHQQDQRRRERQERIRVCTILLPLFC